MFKWHIASRRGTSASSGWKARLWSWFLPEVLKVSGWFTFLSLPPTHTLSHWLHIPFPDGYNKLFDHCLLALVFFPPLVNYFPSKPRFPVRTSSLGRLQLGKKPSDTDFTFKHCPCTTLLIGSRKKSTLDGNGSDGCH